eukprot:11925777-Prorocentrum_lima.AAC.1
MGYAGMSTGYHIRFGSGRSTRSSRMGASVRNVCTRVPDKCLHRKGGPLDWKCPRRLRVALFLH